jgi:hypothetical protein
VADWLELELAETLSPAEPPGELWERLQIRRDLSSGRVASRSVPLMLAAAALLLGAVWLAVPGTRRPRPPRPAPSAERQACFLCHTTL